VAQVAVLGAERQLHSHLRGSLNAGVDKETIDAMLELILPDADPGAQATARRVWSSIRP
jgi:alkylhydroperoxidase/carboxymuconolactone decarboxylase family protein YurZ